jgi:hypothetical protein
MVIWRRDFWWRRIGKGLKCVKKRCKFKLLFFLNLKSDKMKGKSLLICFYLAFAATTLFAQTTEEDPMLKTVQAFFDQMIGEWETIESKVYYSKDNQFPSNIKITSSWERMDDGIGVVGAHKSEFSTQESNAAFEGSMRFLYSKPQKVIHYSYWRKGGMAGHWTVKMVGNKWLTESADGKMLGIAYFDDEGYFITEETNYGENNELLYSVMYKAKKVK